MSENKILKIGITQGDINGIGPEIIIKALADSRMGEMFTPVVYGSSKVFAHYKKGMEEGEGFSFHIVGSAGEALPKRINFVETGDPDPRIETGESTPEGGAAAVAALEAAVQDLKAGYIDALVTAPFNKENVQGAGFSHTGHTEYIAAHVGGQPLMMMCSDIMKVGLVTIHMPVAKVSETLTKSLITARIEQIRKSLVQDSIYG